MKTYKYAIIPVSFIDYDYYVDILNEYGTRGWEFISLIKVYENSPEGYTTHDYLCRKRRKR